MKRALGLALVWSLTATLGFAQGQTGFPIQGQFSTIQGLIAGIINFMLLIGGTLALLAIIYGGFQYVTAGGDEQKVAQARSTITYAIVGVVISVSAWAVVAFIADQLRG